jgi:hypothetical protein
MTNKTIIRDTVIEEIHRTREEIAAKFNYDIAAITADAQKRLEASGRPIWKGPSTGNRKQSTTNAAEPDLAPTAS